MQFVGGVQLGQFVEAHCEVVRTTRSVLFMEVKMFVGARIVVSASGIWKIFGGVISPSPLRCVAAVRHALEG